MRHFAVLVVLGWVAACPAASESTPTAPSCIPANECGCRIVVAAAACPAGHAHYFRELVDGASLQFGDGQGAGSVASAQLESNTGEPAPSESWTETYRFRDSEVQIRYAPGADTCPKRIQGEECEYFDVRARVSVTGPQGTWQYSGAGSCGC